MSAAASFRPPGPPEGARDEMLDAQGRLRGPWRRMLGMLLGLGTASLRERIVNMDRAFAEGGVATLIPDGADAGQWRCDPIPMLFTEAEFQAIAQGLVQRARVLEALLDDLYGPQSLLADGTVPPALVFANPGFLIPCAASAGEPVPRQLQLYAADILRGPDGQWRVVNDRAAAPSGLAYVLENRRMMARVLPELFRSLEVTPVLPFFDAWQDTLQRLAPAGAGNPGLALLTPGHADPRWFEHVMLARQLSCALVEDGDLTVRDGALFLKTLSGLQPVHVLIRRQDGRSIDPLELPAASGMCGVPGLLSAMRDGTVRVLNGPGAALAEAPGFATLMGRLSQRLLGEDLLLPGAPTVWLGDAAGRAQVLRDLDPWLIRSATDGASDSIRPSSLSATGRDRLARAIEQRPWDFVALAALPPSYAPCVGDGDTLEPRSVLVRVFLLFDGRGWRPLPGGIGRVLSPDDVLAGRLPRHALSKDVWVLMEEGADIIGPGNLSVPALSIRRTAGDLPSRVADNFFWLGRYMERLETAARLIRAVLERTGHASLMPRERPGLAVLLRCLIESGFVQPVIAEHTSPELIAGTLLREAAGETGGIATLLGHVRTLTGPLRDRLSGDMHAAMLDALRGIAQARRLLRPLREGAAPEQLRELSRAVLTFSATVAGFAAENMVRGGGHLFMDLGRRIERAHATAFQLSRALDQPPDHCESALHLALELCDSVITYRTRYLTILQPAPVLDLVLADEGNPRALAFQLLRARSVLGLLERDDAGPLAASLDQPLAEARAIVAELAGPPDQQAAPARLPERLDAIAGQITYLSDALTRRYFTLLPVTSTDDMRQD